jgi:hypothetical protein
MEQQVCKLYDSVSPLYPGQIYQPNFCKNTIENFGSVLVLVVQFQQME